MTELNNKTVISPWTFHLHVLSNKFNFYLKRNTTKMKPFSALKNADYYNNYFVSLNQGHSKNINAAMSVYHVFQLR